MWIKLRRSAWPDLIRGQTRADTGFSTITGMADAASLDERLEQIGTQLDWVRDYL
jgi:hypothetical protein